MANILLIDTDEVLCEELTERLSPRNHNVTACHSVSEAVSKFLFGRTGYGLIALNISRNRQEDWKAFEEVCTFLQLRQEETRFLCFSTVYWGPQMQLAVERKGGRFVYLG
jgi:ActR/RegA family two-component response regulator